MLQIIKYISLLALLTGLFTTSIQAQTINPSAISDGLNSLESWQKMNADDKKSLLNTLSSQTEGQRIDALKDLENKLIQNEKSRYEQGKATKEDITKIKAFLRATEPAKVGFKRTNSYPLYLGFKQALRSGVWLTDSILPDFSGGIPDPFGRFKPTDKVGDKLNSLGQPIGTIRFNDQSLFSLQPYLNVSISLFSVLITLAILLFGIQSFVATNKIERILYLVSFILLQAFTAFFAVWVVSFLAIAISPFSQSYLVNVPNCQDTIAVCLMDNTSQELVKNSFVYADENAILDFTSLSSFDVGKIGELLGNIFSAVWLTIVGSIELLVLFLIALVLVTITFTYKVVIMTNFVLICALCVFLPLALLHTRFMLKWWSKILNFFLFLFVYMACLALVFSWSAALLADGISRFDLVLIVVMLGLAVFFTLPNNIKSLFSIGDIDLSNYWQAGRNRAISKVNRTLIPLGQAKQSTKNIISKIPFRKGLKRK
jgi:hypothetical protein